MSNILASILVRIDTSQGSDAIDYAPGPTCCPILSFNCVSSSGSGEVKVTPLSATYCRIVSDSGSGGRLRITADGYGSIESVEIASKGVGYPDGPISIEIQDPYGSGGEIYCEASKGSISKAAVISPGKNYSGYVLFDVNDFIEGVTYTIVPRYIEQTSGSGALKLIGYRLPYRPSLIF